MTYYRRVGHVPPKRHTVHRDDGGNRLLEQLMGTQGFSGASSLLYHRASPSALLSIDEVDDPRDAPTPNHPLRPVHLRTPALPEAAGADLVTGRVPLLGNDDVGLAVVTGDSSSPLYQTVVGDELVFLAQGSARLETVFGALDLLEGDYVVIPSGTTHRWVPSGTVRALVLEARGHIGIPRRYRTAAGQLLEGAPYSERDLRGPGEPLVAEGEDVPVLVRTRAGLSRHRHATHPFDVVGWDGTLYPYALSIHEFEPIVGRIHQPPTVHQTFEGPGFVVCSFVPRLLDFDPESVKVPYHHANVDSDEVLFYVDGSFTSRAGSGIAAGSLSLHPPGFVHGPQPGSWERSVDATRTDELAVMVDTFRPLGLTDAARSISDPGYLGSWT